MSFMDIASPLAELGLKVFPLQPSRKEPPKGMKFLQEATTSLSQLRQWNDTDPNYNVGILADENFCFLEFDIRQGMKQAAEEMDEDAPLTRVQRSGRGFGHFIFRHTDLSRKLGNRSVNLREPCTCDKEVPRCNCSALGKLHHHHEWFSFRADNKYLVGAGSKHPDGGYYSNLRDVEPLPIPNWICAYIQRHAMPQKPKGRSSEASVSDDFDFAEFLEFFDISGYQDGDWFITDECPVSGRRHRHSHRTGFFYDGGTLGFNCFAQGCEGSSMTIGKVISHLNGEKGEPYKGVIWDRDDEDDDDADNKWKIDFLGDEDDEEEIVVSASPVDIRRILTADEFEAIINAPSPNEQIVTIADGLDIQVNDHTSPEVEGNRYVEGVTELAKELKWDGDIAISSKEPAPKPDSLDINDPEGSTGMEFPGDIAMYGKLAEIAHRTPKLQLGWPYPSLLAVASVTGIEEASSSPWRTRSNMYVALLGSVGYGKNVHMDAARAALWVTGAEQVYVEDAPNSHGGLMNQLSEEEPVTRLLFLDELLSVTNACAIIGSNLPTMLCTLWNKDKTGGSVRKGRDVAYGKLSILGGLAINDSAEFSRVFGVNSAKGIYDRFLFGYSTTRIKFNRKDMPSKAEMIDVRPVHIADWVYDAKNEWIGDDPQRGRMSEHVMRVALVTAGINGDMEITKPCLEAAFRFIEWQMRLRQVFKPGVAETKEAECYEAVYSALRERYEQQKATKTIPKGAELITSSIPMDQRWKLIHFTQVVNAKSYYRRYAGLIDRVRKSMVDTEIIREFKDEFEDDDGKTKKLKTPFVVIVADLK